MAAEYRLRKGTAGVVPGESSRSPSGDAWNISSLSVPHNITRGWLVGSLTVSKSFQKNLVYIPFDRTDGNNYYTIELRTPHNYDRGIPQV